MKTAITRETPFDDLPDVMVPAEVAAYLGMHVKTVRDYISSGMMRAARMGRNYYVRREWINDFLEESAKR